jgi:hypothetical protein
MVRYDLTSPPLYFHFPAVLTETKPAKMQILQFLQGLMVFCEICGGCLQFGGPVPAFCREPATIRQMET